MRFLIISSGFTGATLPLANHLSQKGIKVVCYNFVERGAHFIESLDFGKPIGIPTGKRIMMSKKNQIYYYLDKNVDYYILPYWKRKLRLEKIVVGRIFPWLNSQLVEKYKSYVLSENPDFVNIIIHTRLDLRIATALKLAGVPFCVSYHEVLQGLENTSLIKYVVKESLKLDVPIILHSHNTANILIRALDDKSIQNRIHIINFGAFESYLSYGEGTCPVGLPNNYLLFLGHVHPYKGLKYLYEAVKLIDDNLGDIKIVVAGGGYDPIIDKMKLNSRFVIYNYFIVNSELVGLIQHCQAIICPYIAASQSGLVQTGMVFNKPIIATRVGAFTEIIHDGKNGYLCEPSDSQALADVITKFIENKFIFSSSDVPNNLKWDYIADKYLQVCNKIV